MNQIKTKAFTLVELIVVITILAVLGTIAFLSFQGYSRDARDSLRLSDFSSIKTSLEVFKTTTGIYPEPTNSTAITYSGAEIWIQGTFGDSVVTNLSNLNKKPVDPLLGTEYVYSRLNTKKEYEIGGVLEGDLAYNPILPQANASSLVSYVKGTYNGVVAKVNTGSTTYVLSVPTIIGSDIGNADIMHMIQNKLLAYNGFANLPSSYGGLGYTMSGGFDFTPSDIVVFEGNTNDLNDINNLKILTSNIQTVYTGTDLEGLGDYANIINVDVDNNSAVTMVIGNMANTYLGANVEIIIDSQTESAGGGGGGGGSWMDVDPNCDIPDIEIGSQIWAGCNSTLGTGFEYDTAGTCGDFNWGTTPGNECTTPSNAKEIDRNATYGIDNIWGKLYNFSNVQTACSDGWSVPSVDDWTTLSTMLNGGVDCVSSDCSGLGWLNHTSKDSTNNIVQALKLPLSGRNEVDTNASYDRGNGAFLALSDNVDPNFMAVWMDVSRDGVSVYASPKIYGANVRCMKGNSVIDGMCGGDNGNDVYFTPTNLCASGLPSVVVDNGVGSTYTWTCDGIGGGTSSPTCSANHLAITLTQAEADELNSLTGNSFTIQEWLSQTSLNLGSKGLTSIPTGVYDLINLTSLALSTNNLSKISSDITNLNNLIYLYLGNNSLLGNFSNTFYFNNATVYTQIGVSPDSYSMSISGNGTTLDITSDMSTADAVCGTDNGKNMGLTPYRLCYIGTPSEVTDNGVGLTYDWTCSGISGGATVNCSANHAGNFVSTWDVGINNGQSGYNNLKLPLGYYGTYNFTVDWGDGTSDTITTYNQAEATHNYSTGGVYDVTITGQIDGFTFHNNSDSRKLIDVKQWGSVSLADTGYQFAATSNLVSFSATDTLYTSNITNMYQMFASATLFNGDISGWDTSNVTNMSSMFANADAFNQPLSSWDVSSVTNMSTMFYGTDSFNQPLSAWNTSSVTNMSRMFDYASVFNSDISGWDTSSVTNMSGMFNYASAFNSDISGWNTSSVTNMSGMFGGPFNLFNQPLDAWDTSNVTTMAAMFANNNAFNQPLNTWNTSNVTTMYQMFGSADNFNQPLSAWNTSSVTDMGQMFYYAFAFNQDISAWNTSNVTSMASMFYGTSFNQSLSAWDTSSVTNMSSMFNSTDLFDQPLGAWNTSSVTNMSSMFNNAVSFNQDISGWNTSSVTNMAGMFANADSFNQPLGVWNTSNVTNMGQMFYLNNAFDQPLSTWDTSSVTSMGQMFQGAISFNQSLSSWNTISVTDMNGMFANNTIFNGDISTWNTSNVTYMYNMFYSAINFNQDLSGWNVSNVISYNNFDYNTTSWVLPKPTF